MAETTAVNVLGIETSCDETSVALLRVDGPAVSVEKQLLTTQIPIHARYGGVVPEVAARSHVAELVALLTEVMHESYDVVAATRGPGLPTALAVGLEAGKILVLLTEKSFVGVNHLEGHLASAWLSEENRTKWEFPMLALSVSGGHSELILMRDWCSYEVVGETRDDAAGEAFDKTAKLIGLPYPGGPAIEALAKGGDASKIALPRPMLNDDSCDMSFSGLKTAVRVWFEEHRAQMTEQDRADLAAAVQQAIADVLITKTLRAASRYAVRGIVFVGGVSANQSLRLQLQEAIQNQLQNVAFLPSERKYVTDNAAMIAAAGYWRWKAGKTDDPLDCDIDPGFSLS